MTTIAAPLSAVSTTQEWFSLSSLMALISSGVRLDLGGGKFFLFKWLDSILSSSASLTGGSGACLLYGSDISFLGGGTWAL